MNDSRTAYRVSGCSREAPTSALTAAVAVGMAGLILLTGTWLAGTLREKGGEVVVAQVFQQENKQLQGMENSQRRVRTLELLQQYLFAFTDAAIRFETVPKLDTKAFFSIATAMPDDMTVERMEFDHYDIQLECTASQEASQTRFVELLLEGDAFEQVLCTDGYWREDGTWYFSATCVPGEAEGRLNLSSSQNGAATTK